MAIRRPVIEIAIGVLAVVAGCVPPLVVDARCSSDAQCGAARRCVEGLCVVVASPDVGVRDVTADAPADTAADLPPDPDRLPSLVVTASDGESDAAVRVHWEPFDGAASYVVWRDGDPVGTVDAPPFLDPGAAPAGPPPPPTDVVASQGTNVLVVELDWLPSPSPAGRPHEYDVTAVSDDGRLLAAGRDTGFRAPTPTTGYLVRATAEVVREFHLPSSVTHFEDAGAPPSGYSRSVTTSSEATCLGCISAELFEPAVEAAVVTYDVAALTVAGAGTPSDRARGWRGVPAPVFALVVYPDGEPVEGVVVGTSSEPLVVVDRSDPVPTAYRARLLQVAIGGTIDHGPLLYTHAAVCDEDADCGVRRCVRGLCAPEGTVVVPAGTGVIGVQTDIESLDGEVRRAVRYVRPRVMDETEVTQREWEALLGANPSHFPTCGPDCPVESVSWWSAVAFANARSERDGLPHCYVLPDACTGNAAEGSLDCGTGVVGVDAAGGDPQLCVGWRLPTDAEWEYAARAMRDMATPWTNDVDAPYDCAERRAPELLSRVWFCLNARAEYDGCVFDAGYCSGTQPVAGLEPNPWGLYDILGNVAEWVWDAPVARGDELAVEPFVSPAGETDRIRRGGSWASGTTGVRVARRGMLRASSGSRGVGLRLVRTDWP